MIQGTASDVGKSFIAAAICRLFVKEGYTVAPFKSQNMTKNTIVLDSGGEIGKSQYYQAEAAQIRPTVQMNPILLKPQTGSIEVVLLGKVIETIVGRNYRDKFYAKGVQVIQEAITELASQYEVIVMEGAGSPVELNLKDRELVNMKVAELADVPVLLVTDIDRGGVFASVVGTLVLLSKRERARVKGIIINKFRGNVERFQEGISLLEEKAGVPVIGVVPHADQEESTANSFDDQAALIRKNIDWDKLKEIIFHWRDV